MAEHVNLWTDPEHALSYLAEADSVPHRTEGEGTLLQLLPENVERVLDLGCGDGRLSALVLSARPSASVMALDFSETMLAAARERFADQADVTVMGHDLSEPLPAAVTSGGPYDAVVSSFAIHHVSDERKRSLYAEMASLLRPGGLLANLEHVASPTAALHAAFLRALHSERFEKKDDPSNILAPVEDQLGWLRETGLVDVDCFWKWRELALLAGSAA